MKKLFTSDKFFLAATIIGVLSIFIVVVYSFTGHRFYPVTIFQLVPIFQLGCEVALFVSFKKHSKNVMKGMMGAMLMLIVVDAANNLQGYEATFDKVCCIVYFVLAVFLFINHFMINSTHLASKSKIFANQISVFMIAIIVIVWEVASFPMYSNFIDYMLSILTIISFTCFATVVVCVESRLDAYRLDREAAGWTEEAGYPEGYVHEYEKNK